MIKLLRLSKQKGPNNKNFVNDDGCHSGEDDDNEKASGVDDLCSSSYSEMEMGLFKEKFIHVLKSAAFEDKRSCKLSNEELLHLLSTVL